MHIHIIHWLSTNHDNEGGIMCAYENEQRAMNMLTILQTHGDTNNKMFAIVSLVVIK
jgi:hypothetical protein